MLAPSFDEVIQIKGERVTQAQITAFQNAVRASSSGMPPSFPTVFRAAEFKFLDRLNANMRHLLHTEQEYAYLQPLVAGDEPLFSTRFTSHRERRGTHFMTLATEISCAGVVKIIATTSFVIRGEGEAK